MVFQHHHQQQHDDRDFENGYLWWSWRRQLEVVLQMEFLHGPVDGLLLLVCTLMPPTLRSMEYTRSVLHMN